MRPISRRLRWILPCCSLLAASCGFQTYQEKPLQGEAWVERYGQRDLNDPALRDFLPGCGLASGPWPRSSWDGPSLQCAAMFFHPELARARAAIDVAKAGERSAGQRPNPAATLTVEHHGGKPEAGSPWGVGPSFDVPLELGGKRAARIERAVAETTAAEIDLDARAWLVRRGVRERLLALAEADRQGAELAAQQAALTSGVALLRRREEMGLTSSFEASSMRIEAQRARLAATTARARQRTARAELAASLSLPAGALDGVAIDTTAFRADPTVTLPPAATLQRQALVGRADIRRALQDYVIAEKSLKQEIARQYPDFTLSPGYFFDPTDNINIWTLGATMVLPLFHRNEGPIAEAQARRELAARTVELVQATIIGEVQSALAGYDELMSSSAQADEVVAEMQQQAARVRQQFELGETDRLAVVRADLETANALALRGELRAEQWRALQRLEDAVQTVMPNRSETGALP
jgi:outer membrane protein TolC